MIDYSSVLLAAVGGGIGGGLATYFAPKIKNKYGKQAIFGLIVIPMQILPLTPLKGVLDKHVFKKTRFELASQDAEKAILADPVIREKLNSMSPDEQYKFMLQSSHDGMYWLELSDLDRWNEIRLSLAQKSKTLCVAFLRGGVSQADLKQAFEKLSDQEIQQWLKISLIATKTSVSKGPKALGVETPTKDMVAHLNELIAFSGPEEGPKLGNAIKNYMIGTDEEACWAAKKIHENAKKLEPEKRKKFLRGLASI
ncbi:hypothetical protein [Bdellovibrio sp. HCB2-146]|uniref:hypothetical protein n=1 Tax=Bdellovibrio sp. HCB2-146 TaxID=3394362 RepID=UPI0039BD06A8